MARRESIADTQPLAWPFPYDCEVERLLTRQCETALAATFSPELVREAGGLLARECKDRGAVALLAPTANIHRSPLGGRSFENFSEDPILSGIMAAAYINGLQESVSGD